MFIAPFIFLIPKGRGECEKFKKCFQALNLIVIRSTSCVFTIQEGDLKPINVYPNADDVAT